MDNPDKKAQWMVYIRRLYDAGLAIITEADKMTVGADVRDPKVLALALLCRTLTNMNGVSLMIETDLIVEARTLTRCCFENLLWIAELADKGAEFVRRMVEDEVASRQGRGKMALSWSERLEELRRTKRACGKVWIGCGQSIRSQSLFAIAIWVSRTALPIRICGIGFYRAMPRILPSPPCLGI